MTRPIGQSYVSSWFRAVQKTRPFRVLTLQNNQQMAEAIRAVGLGERIIPLGNPLRLRQLLADPRIAPRVKKAWLDE